MWSRLVKLCQDLSFIDNHLIPGEQIKIKKPELKDFKEKAKELKKLAESLTLELDRMAAKGKRNDFPKQASYLPYARSLVKRWQIILKEKKYLLGGS